MTCDPTVTTFTFYAWLSPSPSLTGSVKSFIFRTLDLFSHNAPRFTGYGFNGCDGLGKLGKVRRAIFKLIKAAWLAHVIKDTVSAIKHIVKARAWKVQVVQVISLFLRVFLTGTLIISQRSALVKSFLLNNALFFSPVNVLSASVTWQDNGLTGPFLKVSIVWQVERGWQILANVLSIIYVKAYIINLIFPTLYTDYILLRLKVLPYPTEVLKPIFLFGLSSDSMPRYWLTASRASSRLSVATPWPAGKCTMHDPSTSWTIKGTGTTSLIIYFLISEGLRFKWWVQVIC